MELLAAKPCANYLDVIDVMKNAHVVLSLLDFENRLVHAVPKLAGASARASRMASRHGVDARIEYRISELRTAAKLHLSNKEFHEALSCLDLAIDLDCSSYKLYRLRSIAHACLQDFQGSAADADRVMQLAPHIMDGYYHKGFALFNLHDYAGAAHAFQEGLKLNPADKVLRQGFWDAVGLLSQNRSAAS